MKVFNYSEARQNFATLLNTAMTEEVIISRRDGSRFKIVPLEDKKEKTSPLSVKSIKTDITTAEILSVIRESREQD